MVLKQRSFDVQDEDTWRQNLKGSLHHLGPLLSNTNTRLRLELAHSSHVCYGVVPKMAVEGMQFAQQ
jgi:hypothetical protein